MQNVCDGLPAEESSTTVDIVQGEAVYCILPVFLVDSWVRTPGGCESVRVCTASSKQL